jgi:hypothetical protein
VAAGLQSAGAAALTVIADREGDIFEHVALRPERVHLRLRAAQHRALAEAGTLFTGLAGLAELGRMAITLPAASTAPGRTAKPALRLRRVSIRRPASRTGEAAKRLAQSVPLTLIEARQIDPPATPAHWRRLTSHAVASFDDARRRCRFDRGTRI